MLLWEISFFKLVMRLNFLRVVGSRLWEIECMFWMVFFISVLVLEVKKFVLEVLLCLRVWLMCSFMVDNIVFILLCRFLVIWCCFCFCDWIEVFSKVCCFFCLSCWSCRFCCIICFWQKIMNRIIVKESFSIMKVLIIKMEMILDWFIGILE